MAKSYEECFSDLVSESIERIDSNPHITWDEAVRETIEDSVFRMSIETLQNILDNSRPNDEWQIYCDDMSDYEKVQEAMAYVAIREDVIEHLMNEHGYEL